MTPMDLVGVRVEIPANTPMAARASVNCAVDVLQTWQSVWPMMAISLPPLTALANAHVEIATALVSFERVFEVLDLVPLIQETPDAVPVPDGPVSVEFDDVRFSYPSADKVSLASLEEVAVLDDRGGDEVLHGISFRAQPGQMVALVGSSGAGKSTIASLVARLYDVDSGAVRVAGVIASITADPLPSHSCRT